MVKVKWNCISEVLRGCHHPGKKRRQGIKRVKSSQTVCNSSAPKMVDNSFLNFLNTSSRWFKAKEDFLFLLFISTFKNSLKKVKCDLSIWLKVFGSRKFLEIIGELRMESQSLRDVKLSSESFLYHNVQLPPSIRGLPFNHLVGKFLI